MVNPRSAKRALTGGSEATDNNNQEDENIFEKIESFGSTGGFCELDDYGYILELEDGEIIIRPETDEEKKVFDDYK